MRITEVKRRIKRVWLASVRAGVVPRSRLILGKPGIGKTEIGLQIAREVADALGLDLAVYDARKAPSEYGGKLVYVYHNLNEIESTDLVGVPRDRDGYVEYKPLSWAVVCSERPCLIHLDEITSTQRDENVSAAMKIVCERMVGYVPLSKETLVVATGNRPEENVMARLLPAPFVNKVAVHEVDEPSIEEWGAYMNDVFGDAWDRRVLAYLSEYSGDFCVDRVDEETLKPYPTPRAWTNLAVELAIAPPSSKDELVEAVAGYVGYEVASRVVTYLKTQLDARKVVKNPELIKELSFSQRYLVASWLANHWMDKGVWGVFEWLARNDREMLVLTYRMVPQSQLRTFIKELIKRGKREEMKVLIRSRAEAEDLV